MLELHSIIVLILHAEAFYFLYLQVLEKLSFCFEIWLIYLFVTISEI